MGGIQAMHSYELHEFHSTDHYNREDAQRPTFSAARGVLHSAAMRSLMPATADVGVQAGVPLVTENASETTTRSPEPMEETTNRESVIQSTSGNCSTSTQRAESLGLDDISLGSLDTNPLFIQCVSDPEFISLLSAVALESDSEDGAGKTQNEPSATIEDKEVAEINGRSSQISGVYNPTSPAYMHTPVPPLSPHRSGHSPSMIPYSPLLDEGTAYFMHLNGKYPKRSDRLECGHLAGVRNCSGNSVHSDDLLDCDKNAKSKERAHTFKPINSSGYEPAAKLRRRSDDTDETSKIEESDEQKVPDPEEIQMKDAEDSEIIVIEDDDDNDEPEDIGMLSEDEFDVLIYEDHISAHDHLLDM